jgi:hypothetical protein
LHTQGATPSDRQAFGTDAAFQEFAMRGSTVDQVRKDIDSHRPDDNLSDKVSEQMRAAETAAGLPPLSRSEENTDPSGALWFAVGAGLSAAAIAVAAAVS